MLFELLLSARKGKKKKKGISSATQEGGRLIRESEGPRKYLQVEEEKGLDNLPIYPAPGERIWTENF